MKDKHKLFLGLAFPNGIIFGLLFLSIGLFGMFGIISSLFSNDEFNPRIFFGFIFILIALLIGLLPTSSYKLIKLDFASNKIQVGTVFFFFVFENKEHDIKDIKTLKIDESKKHYSVGGGFLASARSSFAKKETDIIFISSKGKAAIKLENISRGKLNQLINIIQGRTDIKVVQ